MDCVVPDLAVGGHEASHPQNLAGARGQKRYRKVEELAQQMDLDPIAVARAVSQVFQYAFQHILLAGRV